MSRFSEELKIIPTPARVIAALVYVLCAAGFWAIFTFAHDPGMANLPKIAIAALIFVAPIPLTLWVLLIGYVNADAKRRGMRYVMWTLLAIFIPNAIGIILYFILRDPRMRACPNCSQLAKPGFAFCPHCGQNMSPACPSCRRAVEPGWRNCPACGTVLSAATQAPGAVPPYAGPQTA
jgi:RNA polymerase subunit RPABC4/transcription elongation factor Spt4